MDIEQLAGTRLGNYQIESLLGQGGMGVVYKARQISLSRPVALKILPPHLSSDASFVKRFKREAQAVAQLDHPNLVQIFDIVRARGLHFFSMQYVEGKTLDEVLKQRGRLNADEAINIVLQAAQGIEHAHKNGIIHRDIKPSNIIIDESGNAKVMDFGLARTAEERSRLTRSGTLIGTLDYMSPEQCRGDEVDGRTDIYSLGVVLYEALTGRMPFEAPNEAALIHKIINEDPPDIQALNPNVPISLSKVIFKAMAKDKEDRYGEIGELIEDLRSCAAAVEPVKKTTPIATDMPPASVRRPYVSFAAIAAILVCLSMVGIIFLRRPKSEGPIRPETIAAPAEEKTYSSIAVLPFVNMSADPEQEYFCDGIAEELINALAQLEDLRVIARTSAFSFKGKSIDIREIGRKLDVETILEGSVRKSGNKLRITAQLVDVQSNDHLWSERYDKEMEDILAIQDEITLAIVDRLKPKLLPAEKTKLAASQTVDAEVYDLYLRGWHFYNKTTPQDLEKACRYFTQVIEKDPEYAPAYAGLATCERSRPFLTPARFKDARKKVKELAQKALELDENCDDAHRLMAWARIFFDWDWQEAENEFKRAIALNPGNLRNYADYEGILNFMGRPGESLEMAKRALGLDPLSPFTNHSMINALMENGHYMEAMKHLQRAIELFPDYPWFHTYLGGMYLVQLKFKEALDAFQKGKAAQGWIIQLEAEHWIGITYALMGKKEEAQRVLDNLVNMSEEKYVPPYFIWRLYMCLGDADKAYEWLDKAYAEQDYFILYLKIDPGLEMFNLRSDPRYLAMLKKMNLEPLTDEEMKLKFREAPVFSSSPVAEEETYSSIAVLPFVDMSPDKDQEYFCDGMAETLINGLTQIEDLRVIARTSAFSFKGQNIDVREIGKKLGVDAILEGSIQRAGNKLRITAQLVDTKAGHHLWSQKYDRELKDIFDIQDDITKMIVENLKPKLFGEEKGILPKSRPEDIEAHDLYLKGLFFYRTGWASAEGMKKALDYFEKAIEKSPDYAPPYTGKAFVYIDLGFHGPLRPREVFPKAREAALKALELDDTLAQAHTALGAVKQWYEWDWNSAEREYRRAIELNPSYEAPHAWLATSLTHTCRFDEAFKEVEIARQMDPLAIAPNHTVGWVYFRAGRDDLAIDALNRLLEMEPNLPQARLTLAGAYWRKGLPDKAMKELEQANVLAKDWNTEIRAYIGGAYALMGKKEKVRTILNELLERANREYVSPTFIAGIYFTLGENDKGFAWLDNAYEERDPFLANLKVGMEYDTIRLDPRYHALLKKVGLDT
jgi:TolB-like protein/serine/threonine protein kinase/Tfp pilus assembly protein PilF